ncbi:MAG: hypothetical protein II863_06860 [Kiritimatiellae bacterium]|nr:hypothetical protein [Kiritimatiellia bacterium]
MVNPSELSKRQLGILLAVWNTGHEALSKRRQPFKTDKLGVICELPNRDKVTTDDEDFLRLIDEGYIEPIGTTVFIITEEADTYFDDILKAFTEVTR